MSLGGGEDPVDQVLGFGGVNAVVPGSVFYCVVRFRIRIGTCLVVKCRNDWQVFVHICCEWCLVMMHAEYE